MGTSTQISITTESPAFRFHAQDPRIPEGFTPVALTVDGEPVDAFDLDTTAVGPHELDPPAYSRDEVDDLLAAAAPVQDTGAQTDFATTWTVVAGLAVPVTAESTADVFAVDLLLDLAAYAANTGLLVINLTVDGTGHPETFPVRLPAANFRLPIPCAWLLTGLTPGAHTLGVAGVGAGTTTTWSYQSGTGTKLTVERKA